MTMKNLCLVFCSCSGAPRAGRLVFAERKLEARPFFVTTASLRLVGWLVGWVIWESVQVEKVMESVEGGS